MGLMPSRQSWIVFPRWHILFQQERRFLPQRWQLWFLTMYSECGDYQLTFCLIEIPDLPGIFGERCSDYPEPTLREGPPTIMKQMGKPKESTWLLKNTYAILFRPIKRIGQSTLQWASSSTIQVSIWLPGLHHSFWPRAGRQGRRLGL